MIGQNGREDKEVEDLYDGEDSRSLAAAPSQPAEDFRTPLSTPHQEEGKIKSYCQTMRKRNRGHEDEDEQQKMLPYTMSVIVTPTHLLDEDENVLLECKMLRIPTPNTTRRSGRFKKIKANRSSKMS